MFIERLEAYKQPENLTLTLDDNGGVGSGSLADTVLSMTGEHARVLHCHVLQHHLHRVLQVR